MNTEQKYTKMIQKYTVILFTYKVDNQVYISFISIPKHTWRLTMLEDIYEYSHVCVLYQHVIYKYIDTSVSNMQNIMDAMTNICDDSLLEKHYDAQLNRVYYNGQLMEMLFIINRLCKYLEFSDAETKFYIKSLLSHSKHRQYGFKAFEIYVQQRINNVTIIPILEFV